MKRFKVRGLLAKYNLVMRLLVVGWRARPWAILGFFGAAGLEIAAFTVSLYANAQLASLLARYFVGSSVDGIWFWLWIDIAAVATLGATFWLMDWAKRLLYYRTATWVAGQFHAALCKVDIADFYDEKIRNRINKVNQGGYNWRIPNLIDIVLDIIYGILRFAVIALLVAQITWWLIPLIAVFLLPAVLINSRIAKLGWFVWDEKGDERHIFWGLDYIIRKVKGQMELRSTQSRSHVKNILNKMNIDFYKKQESELAKPSRLMVAGRILDGGGTAIGSIILLRQFLFGAITLDKFFFLSGALMRIGGAISTVFGSFNRLQEPLLVAEEFFKLVDYQPVLVDKPGAIKLKSQKPPEIVFKDVNFTYPGQTKPVFVGLSFKISSGEHLAIVGENGAGKSTIIKLLLRFYRPTGGHILIDGQDLQDIAIESWYERMATLFQDFNYYPLSVQENIEIAKTKFKGDSKRLKRAAQAAGVDKFVKNYKYGWQTVLDNSFEKGIEPSGGQWQRVALARAFYRQASVLILDEPTAAIDAKAEYDIFNNIFKHYQNKTTIIVSHRFSTVRRAHTIIVIDQGKIVESGTHAELIKIGGLYHDMFNKQAEGYRG